MALDFPSPPTSGTTFTGGDGSWRADGTKWKAAGGQGIYLPLTGGTVTGRLTVSMADTAPMFLLAGTTDGIRLFTGSAGSTIEGVDRTGTGSYQPLYVGGSSVILTCSGGTAATINASGLTLAGNYLYGVNGTGTINGSGGPFIYFDPSWIINHLGSGNQGWQVQNSAGTPAATISGAGNLGLAGYLGVGTSAASDTASGAVYMGGPLSTASNNLLSQNAYQATGNVWKIINTGPASALNMGSGGFQFYSAPSGTAGATPAWSQKILFDANGTGWFGGSTSTGLATSLFVTRSPASPTYFWDVTTATFQDGRAMAAGIGGAITFEGQYTTAGGTWDAFGGIGGTKANATTADTTGNLYLWCRTGTISMYAGNGQIANGPIATFTLGSGSTNPLITLLGGARIGTLNTGSMTRAQLDSAFGSLNNSGCLGIGWNYSAGGGETNFFLNRGGGNASGLFIYDFPNTSGSPLLLMGLSGTGAMTVTTSVTAQNIVGSSDVTAQSYVSGTNGSVSLVGGSTTLPGFIEWRMPSSTYRGGTRRGYMGWDTTNVTLTLENSSNFYVVGGEIVSTLGVGNYGGLRLVGGNYGAMFRQDGTTFYILFTASGAQYGTWNALRPFAINVANGMIAMGHGLSVNQGGQPAMPTGHNVWIFDDGNGHIECDTQLWLNGNTNQAIACGGGITAPSFTSNSGGLTLNVGTAQTGNLTVFGSLSVSTGNLTMNGTPFASANALNAGYNIHKDNNGANSLYLGNSSDQQNYYRQNAHLFQGTDSGGSVSFAKIGPNGYMSYIHVYPATDNADWCGVQPWTQNWYAVSAYSHITASDVREKTDIEELPNCLDLVRMLNPKRYRLRNCPDYDRHRLHWGFVAQEVGEVMDAAGYDFSGGLRREGEAGPMMTENAGRPEAKQIPTFGKSFGLSYHHLTAVLWKAVQELSAEVADLKARLA